MTLVSPPFSTPEWIFPTITNKYEPRLASRKRCYDADRDEQNQENTEMHSREANKKAKLMEPLRNVSNASNASVNARAPQEFMAGTGDWRYEPHGHDEAIFNQGDDYEDDADAPAKPVDVEKVIAILLNAINASHQKSTSELGDVVPCARSYHRQPTSPLSDSSVRTPFVRKSVGGGCRGRLEPGLKKWVLCKNHVQESSEWIEALHEMGWEHLHPTYAALSQQTFNALDAFPTSDSLEWIEVDVSREQENDSVARARRVMDDRDVWILEVQSPNVTPSSLTV
ncbi:hypothetical protein K439DRAFT_1624222 [Ramaria rubella]|nr:hypothetical protein K439DRAFT_1624222 [Ramaria rubella]